MKPFSTFCGPAAVASALGISREDAAARLDAAAGIQHTSSTNIHTIAKVLKRPCDRVVNESALGWGRAHPGYSNRRYDGSRMRPTLAQWLRVNRRIEAVLRASNHFVHVRNGRIIEANNMVQMRARVTHEVLL
jgi:hypothetical protein